MKFMQQVQLRRSQSIQNTLLVKLCLAIVYLLTSSQLIFAQELRIPESSEEIKLSFSPLVKRVAPAVVNVYASRMVQRTSPFMSDPFFGRILRDRSRSRIHEDRSLGSGVIVSSDGVVVTNHHVIKDADEVKIVLADRREYEADIILKDERTDLAALKIRNADETVFTAVAFSESDTLEVGDLVIAIGNPFGVGQTVTQGIVSALARTQVGVSDYQSFIQTDAAINPGNSGGALIDMQGNLVGINTAIYTRSGGSNGIGFAIPAAMVLQVVDSAKVGTRVQRPWFGASFQAVTADTAESLGFKVPTGVFVTGVEEFSPAKDAGIKVGDLILEVAGKEITNPDEFNFRFATLRIGGFVELTVRRGHEIQTITVALQPPQETVPRNELELENSPLRGAIVVNLSPAVAEEFRMPTDSKGVVVTQIYTRSSAQRIGLQAGDIIREVNGIEIDTTDTLDEITSQRTNRWDLRVERKGTQLRISLRG